MATNYNYFGNLVTNGLVLDLDAAKLASYPGSGTTWFDISGNGNNGTLTNGPTFSGVGKQAAIVFDGTNDYVDLGTTNFGITRDFTFSFWMDMTQSGSMQIFSKGYNSPWGIYIDKQHTTNVLSCQISLTSGFAQTDTINNNYSGVKNWTIVRNNTSLTWYVNGSQDNTSNISSLDISQSVSKQWRLGNNFDSPSLTTFKGNIYNQLIYNRALSASEVQQNFNATRARFGI